MSQGELFVFDVKTLSNKKNELSSSPTAVASRTWNKRNPQFRSFVALRSIRKKQGKIFTILFNEIDWRDDCPYCGRNIFYRAGRGADDRSDSASIDCVIPRLQYIRGNVLVCCFRCNEMKGSGGAQEHFQIANGIRRFVNEKLSSACPTFPVKCGLWEAFSQARAA